MGWVDEIAASVLILASIFLMARASGFRASQALMLSFATVVLPMATLFVVYTSPVFVNMAPAIEALSKLIFPIVMFALALSVSRKVASHA